MTYDEWRLSGPDEHQEPEMTECGWCDGYGENRVHPDDPCAGKCRNCGGSGEVPVEAEEPDGDYQYERRRDAAIDRGQPNDTHAIPSARHRSPPAPLWLHRHRHTDQCAISPRLAGSLRQALRGEDVC